MLPVCLKIPYVPVILQQNLSILCHTIKKPSRTCHAERRRSNCARQSLTRYGEIGRFAVAPHDRVGNVSIIPLILCYIDVARGEIIFSGYSEKLRMAGI